MAVRWAGWAAAAAAATSLPVAGGRKAIEVDFYRAMEGANVGVYSLQNNDLASLVGVLKYVHTEVLAEHSLAPFRDSRKYGIDVIARSRFRILNPEDLLSPSSGAVRNVDFGAFVTFDSGVATNSGQLDDIQRHGGYVGVQNQWDVRFPYESPYYWFSVNGFCPNLRWSEKGTEESPNPDCLRSDDGNLVRGGLCADVGDAGAEDVSDLAAQEPIGDENCTYSYGPASVVRLDSLAGVTQEDCGERHCTSWADFRHNCSNASYRFIFSAQTGDAIPVPYCVEYDISPACENNCEAPDCLALPPERRELGLPFWRGRCDARRNAQRAEQLAAAFGIPGATERHALAALPDMVEVERCAYPGGICNPSTLSGGMYCSRAWAGVCTPCWIPGAVLPYPAKEQPFCPYDVLGSLDYREVRPICKSSRPRDLCCLYHSPPTCEISLGTSSPLPLDEDGFAIAAFRQNTTEMLAFLARVAAEKLGVVVADAVGLERLAYWQWGIGPLKGQSLEEVEASLGPLLAANETATTTTTAATASGTITTVGGTSPVLGTALRGTARSVPVGALA